VLYLEISVLDTEPRVEDSVVVKVGNTLNIYFNINRTFISIIIVVLSQVEKPLAVVFWHGVV
jgi:hypothetical protein